MRKSYDRDRLWEPSRPRIAGALIGNLRRSGTLKSTNGFARCRCPGFTSKWLRRTESQIRLARLGRRFVRRTTDDCTQGALRGFDDLNAFAGVPSVQHVPLGAEEKKKNALYLNGFKRATPEIMLEHPDVDEVRDFTSLIVRIRDQNDKGINVDFAL